MKKSNFTAFLIHYIGRYRGLFFVAMLCMALSSLSLLFFPFFTGRIIAEVSGGESWIIQGSLNITVALLLILLLRGVFSFFHTYLFGRVAVYATADVRRDVFSRMVHVPLEYFDEHNSGELVSRLAADVEILQQTFQLTVAQFLRQIVLVVFGMIAVCVIALPLSGIMFLIVLPVAVSVIFLGRALRRRARELADARAAANSMSGEILQMAETVKAFANEQFECERYGRTLDVVRRQGERTALFQAFAGNVLVFCVLGGMAILLYFGTMLISRGIIELADLISFVLYSGFIAGSAVGLGHSVTQIQRASGAAERIREILRQSPERDEAACSAPAEVAQVGGDEQASTVSGRAQGVQHASTGAEISIQDLHFHYPARPEDEIFHGADLKISAGSIVYITGISGEGKTSLFKLLLALYKPQAGEIRVDGILPDAQFVREYRQQFALVPQDVLLFSGTIRDNIAYGMPGAHDAQIEQAAKQANALEFIQTFPDGFDTIIGERGTRLSGGQRQRIAIARAVLRNPRVLLLDEAMNSLDKESGDRVREALQRLMQGRTVIAITHAVPEGVPPESVFTLREGRFYPA